MCVYVYVMHMFKWIGKYILTLVNASICLTLIQYIFTQILRITLHCFALHYVPVHSERICWLNRTTIAKSGLHNLHISLVQVIQETIRHFYSMHSQNTCIHESYMYTPWMHLTCHHLHSAWCTKLLTRSASPLVKHIIRNGIKLALWAWGRSSTKTIILTMQ